MKREKMERVTNDEKETIIFVDVLNSIVELYTTDKKVYNRLLKKIGCPHNVFKATKQYSDDYEYISGAIWKFNYFENRKEVKQIFSVTNILPRKKDNTN